jgi:CubicO group peptidase (beta-lactamase class C family)
MRLALAAGLLLATLALPAQDAARDFPPIEPAALGYDREALDGLVEAMQAWVEHGHIAGGELLVLADGRTLVHAVAGFADIERARPMTEHTLFRIQSMTKTIVGTGILMLRDDGKLDLEAPAARYVPELDTDGLRAMTVRHLLSHTAGFSHPEYNGAVWGREFPTRMDAIRALIAHGTMYAPGERFSYENGNSDTLAEVLQRAAGAPAEQFLTERLFEPLGMQRTRILAPPPAERRGQYASVYRRDDDGLQKIWDADETTDEAFFRGAGGVYSTVTDYARFLMLWLDEGRVGKRQLLRRETVREALTATAASKQAEFPYGLHWSIFAEPPASKLVFGHGGSDGTIAIAVPELRVVVVYFTQTRQTPTSAKMLELCGRLLGGS